MQCNDAKMPVITVSNTFRICNISRIITGYDWANSHSYNILQFIISLECKQNETQIKELFNTIQTGLGI